MTTYLGEKAVGVGTIKTYVAVADVLHDNTLVGNGNTEPLGVNTENIVSQQTLANTVSILNNDIQKTFENSVKKSGDTMTGILTIQAEEDYDPSTPPVGGLSFKSNASPVEFTNRMRQVGNGFIAIEYLLNGKQYSNLVFGDQEIYIDNTENETGNPVSLGTSYNPWDNVYVKKLNNGADISVPTLGGTLARIEDIQNATATLNAGITGNAQAIQKTREDYIQADSEIHQILNSHAGELTTLKNNQGALGDQVSNIESKIPESASDTNPLVTKQQLLDEEMDIRDDYNEMVSELQTQITAQAGAIAGKQDELTAGEGIKIENNVISATGGGASGDYLPLSGGTLTGELTIDAGTSDLSAPVLTFKRTRTTGRVDTHTISFGIGFDFGNAGISNVGQIAPYSKYIDLGSASYAWRRVYVAKLNNGADIAVPTTGGTMVVATPPTEDGTYVLKCVMSGGVPTMTWVKE